MRSPEQDSLCPRWLGPIPKLGPRPRLRAQFPGDSGRAEGTGLGTRRCAGQECRGRAGQLGAARAATREGARREGARRAPAGRGGSRGPEGWGMAASSVGAWDSHEGPRGGDGEESGLQGPGGRGGPHLTARPPSAARCPPGCPSLRVPPRRPRLPPRSPDGAQPRPARRSPRRAPATPCASAGLLKLWAPYPTQALISGLAHPALLGAEKEAETGLEARTKGQRPEPSGDRERARENRTAVRRGLRTPALSCRERGHGSGLSTSRALLRPARWLDPGTP